MAIPSIWDLSSAHLLQSGMFRKARDRRNVPAIERSLAKSSHIRRGVLQESDNQLIQLARPIIRGDETFNAPGS